MEAVIKINDRHFFGNKAKALLFFFSLCSSIGFSQQNTMHKDIKKIKAMGRDSIIQIGFRAVQNMMPPHTAPRDIPKISVFANKKRIRVSFSNPIIYCPLNSAHYYDIGVDLINGVVSANEIVNPEDYVYNKQNLTFFLPTDQSEKDMRFIADAIQKSDSARTTMGSIENILQDPEAQLVIREHQDCFSVSCQIKDGSIFRASSFKIDKQSGHTYQHTTFGESIVPAPLPDDPLIEIKE